MTWLLTGTVAAVLATAPGTKVPRDLRPSVEWQGLKFVASTLATPQTMWPILTVTNTSSAERRFVLGNPSCTILLSVYTTPDRTGPAAYDGRASVPDACELRVEPYRLQPGESRTIVGAPVRVSAVVDRGAPPMLGYFVETVTAGLPEETVLIAGQGLLEDAPAR
jgi:hypothetical protein